jgi:hypothetical protein
MITGIGTPRSQRRRARPIDCLQKALQSEHGRGARTTKLRKGSFCHVEFRPGRRRSNGQRLELSADRRVWGRR